MKWVNGKFDIGEDLVEFGIEFVANTFPGYLINAPRDSELKLCNDYTEIERSNYYDDAPNVSFVNTDNVCATMLDRYGKLKPYYPFCYAGYFFDNFLEVALFIYARDCGVKLERRPSTVNGIVLNKYLPDFKFDDRYICIRPKRLYKTKKHLFVSPNDKDGVFTGHLIVNDDIFDYYSSLGILDAIEFDDEDDFSEVIGYVDEKYGPDYIASFYFNITVPPTSYASDLAKTVLFKTNNGYVMSRSIGVVPGKNIPKTDYIFNTNQGATPFDIVTEDELCDFNQTAE